MRALCSNGCCEDLLAYGQVSGRINHAIEPTICPDGMDVTAKGNDSLVVPILITGIGERISGAFVALSRCHFDIGDKGQTAIG